MEHYFLVQDADALQRYHSFAAECKPAIEQFARYLHENCAVQSLPRAIIWTDAKTATTRISDIPVPAYTNEYRTIFCPDPDAWKAIYLAQLDDYKELPPVLEKPIRECYEALTRQNVLQILGHELVHHSEWFEDDFDDERKVGIWFEEGMAEYISRRYFLDEAAYRQLYAANSALVSLYDTKFGLPDLEAFGAETYRGGYSGLFCAYWRSFLAVHTLVEQYSGSVSAVFDAYHAWLRSGRSQSLSAWFGLR